MHTRFSLIFFLFLIFSAFAISQEFSVQKVEPPNWWIGMEWDTLQLMFYGKDIQSADVSINSDKILITKKYHTKNPDYLFLDLVIPDDVEEAEYIFSFKKGSQNYDFSYPFLKEKMIQILIKVLVMMMLST